MIDFTLEEVLQAVVGQPFGAPPTGRAAGVATDSRAVNVGDVFFALRGERFDGHEFVASVAQAGASAAIVDQTRAAAIADALNGAATTVIGVDDPLRALSRLAAAHRTRLTGEVIAVVGSNGKTTTKAMIHHVLKRRFRGSCSPKSFNNNIGVPLTLLAAESDDDYVVVEIGSNAPGEVAELAALARPTMVVLTCIGEEHLEGFGDLAGVAREECSVFAHMDGDFAAANVDSPAIDDYLTVTPRDRVTFGVAERAELRATDARYERPWLHFRVNGRQDVRLTLPGVHNASNALGALAVARRMGLADDETLHALESFEPPGLRCQVEEIGGVTILNDAYNANPHSARAALEMLASYPATGRRVAVFGEMRELGERSAELHAELAATAAQSATDVIGLVGRAVEWMAPALANARQIVRCSASVDECAEWLTETTRPGDVVLLKASRAVQLEQAAKTLRERLEPLRAD